jgi:hypothetical protein
MLVAATAEGRGADKGWTVLFSGPRRLWVKLRRTRIEHMFSGLPPKAESDLRIDEYTP